MKKLFKPRLLAIYSLTLFLAACASNYTTDNSNHSPTQRPNNSSYSHASSRSSDIWQRVRDGYGMPDLYNAEVTAKENYYAQRADYVGRMASRSGDFMYIIMNEVERRKMPSEIALLPFVESAFVTTAQSPVKAAGLWQFMPATGRDFSLQQNHFADQRNDVVASTNAALTFLERLHNQFGDWQLALAAYNWGPGNVTKAVRRAQASGLAGTYSDIKMPTETRQYVPKLQAIKNIITNPAQYGITLPNINNNQRHELVSITRDIDLSTAARLSGLDVESFKRINPAFKKPIIVASLGTKILVPAEHADEVRSALRSSQNLASLTTYSTYNIESLNDIAAKFNTNADNLRYLNNIPTSHGYVKAGSALLVPRTERNQDIPYEALAMGLSTTTGGIGLGGGDYIEQPTIVVNNSDDVTRQERSGIIKPFPTSSNSRPGLVANGSPNDDLGILIKNNTNPLNDPLPANSSLVRTFNPPALNTSTPIATPTPITLVAQQIESTTPSGLVVHHIKPANVTASNLEVHTPIVAPQPTANVPTQTIAQTETTSATPAALTPFVATVEDTPEVIAEPIAHKVNKSTVAKVTESKPAVKLAAAKTATSKTAPLNIVKVNNNKAKAQLISTNTKTLKTNSKVAPVVAPAKASSAKVSPAKASSAKVSPAKVGDKAVAKEAPKSSNNKPTKQVEPKSSAKSSAKETKPEAGKSTVKKEAPKELVVINNKTKKVTKK